METQLKWLLALPFALQGIAIGVDELVFHRKRGLPRWERIGHPIDSLVFGICLAIPLVCRPEGRALGLFAIGSALSCLLITKDEAVHAKLCTPMEHWLHAVLFVLHPVVLGAAWALWKEGQKSAEGNWARNLLLWQWAILAIFFVYQGVYWNVRKPRSEQRLL